MKACKLVVLMDVIYSGKSLVQWQGRVRMQGGTFHVLHFRRERVAIQKSRMQVGAMDVALRQHASSAPVAALPPNKTAVQYLNELVQQQTITAPRDGGQMYTERTLGVQDFECSVAFTWTDARTGETREVSATKKGAKKKDAKDGAAELALQQYFEMSRQQ